MNHHDMLARLITQAESQGSDLVTLRALIEESIALGAHRALERLGLAEDCVKEDLTELRELLQAWRDAKSSAAKAVITWTVRAILALLLLGIAVRLGLGTHIS